MQKIYKNAGKFPGIFVLYISCLVFPAYDTNNFFVYRGYFYIAYKIRNDKYLYLGTV